MAKNEGHLGQKYINPGGHSYLAYISEGFSLHTTAVRVYKESVEGKEMLLEPLLLGTLTTESMYVCMYFAGDKETRFLQVKYNQND